MFLAFNLTVESDKPFVFVINFEFQKVVKCKISKIGCSTNSATTKVQLLKTIQKKSNHNVNVSESRKTIIICCAIFFSEYYPVPSPDPHGVFAQVNWLWALDRKFKIKRSYILL